MYAISAKIFGVRYGGVLIKKALHFMIIHKIVKIIIIIYGCKLFKINRTIFP